MNLTRMYEIVIEEWADPRTSNWLWMSSPLYIAIIIIGYVYFCVSLGPRLMQNRKPMNIDRIVQLYNIIQISVNLYLFYRAVFLAWGTRYSWRCEALDQSYDPNALEIARTMHLYFLLKCSDLLDTVFFILRKKESHVSFLHVYHHAWMIFGSWFAVKYFPGGHVTFLGLLNSFVHAVMYSYYLMTSLYPKFNGIVWWKKRVTQLQIVQFLLIGLHSSQLFFSNPCNYPIVTALIVVPQNVFMLVLFLDFYRKSYVKHKGH